MSSKGQGWKDAIRKKHLEWVDEQLNHIDFGEPYDMEQLVFALGHLILELHDYKRTYKNQKNGHMAQKIEHEA